MINSESLSDCVQERALLVYVMYYHQRCDLSDFLLCRRWSIWRYS